MTNLTTDDLIEFFSVLAVDGNAYWGFSFMWQEINDNLRVPIYVFYSA